MVAGTAYRAQQPSPQRQAEPGFLGQQQEAFGLDPAGLRVLDVGSGTGFLTLLLAELRESRTDPMPLLRELTP